MDVKSSHIKTSSLNRDIGGILHCSKCYQIMIDGHKCGETKKREDENVEEIFQLIKVSLKRSFDSPRFHLCSFAENC